MMEKKKYVAPAIEVMEVENEGGVMSASLGGALGYDGKMSQTNYGEVEINAIGNELDDMITNILTFE